MTRILARTLSATAVLALTIALAGCDGGGGSDTGPKGEKPRDPDSTAKIQAPGGEANDTASTGTQTPR